jgi:tetratricopeptide (TPR) repeat protein
MRKTGRMAAAFVCLLLIIPSSQGASTEAEWRRLDTTHFAVLSNASERQTRTLAWQLEQVRSAIALVCPWARVDLSKPVLVLAVKDERSMRALAPQYWGRQKDVRPSSIWMGGPDRHYIAIRADLRVEADSPAPVNPHGSAYFAYISLVLNSSFDHDLPVWFTRGLAGVLSNTLVGDNAVEVGRVIPNHLERLQTYRPLPLRQLVTMTRTAKVFNDDEGMFAFDSQAWALVHCLLFLDSGAHSAKLGTFAKLVQEGTDTQAAFEQAFGSVQELQAVFTSYLTRGIYQFMRVNVDLGVKRNGTPLVPVPLAAANGERATFQAVMGLADEPRALIAEARGEDPAQPQSYVAEGLLADRAGDHSAAKAAFEKAIANGSDNAYVFYRSAVIALASTPNEAALGPIAAQLTEAVKRNTRFASAYAALGEVRAALTSDAESAAPLVFRAIALEPAEPSHHLAAARVFWRCRKWDRAVTEARAAERLARTEAERVEAQRTVSRIEEARPR